jgi:hypothetical protein
MTNPSFDARDCKALSDDPRFFGGSETSSVIRGLRSAVTAVIALSLGVALVSWLKAGGQARPSGTGTAVSATSTSGPRALTRTR